jgi:hypothetical protein
MRKSTIFPAIMLSFVTLGTVATALPATAAPSHHASARAAGEDDDSTPPDTSNGGGSTPSGGAATGFGGTATGTSDHSALPWLVTGGAGLALLGAGAGAFRVRRPTEG